MTTPTSASRSQLPYHPRRASTTPAQRPSTSSGEAIEPISDFLADALREKKGLTPRSHSTTPRRAKAGLRSQAYQATLDEWMPSSDEERREARRRVGRPQRARRTSDMSVAKSSPAASQTLGTREATTQMDRLQKANWDLKHRVALQQDRVKRLNEQLEEALEEVEKLKVLRQTNEELNEALDALSKKVVTNEDDMMTMTELNEELLKELELRDTGIKERQLAIEEAAGIIQTLELRVEALQDVKQQSSPKQDFSDYFSGDAEHATSAKKKISNGTPPTITAPDSDYFSADTSPNVTPKTPRKMQLPAPVEKFAQLERARETGASFNREVGLRTAASKDSLLSTFLDAPGLPPPIPKQLGRTLRRRSPAPGIEELQQKGIPRPVVETIRRVATPPWSNSRPLRSLYEQGEFNRQIHAKTPIARMDSTPSVTVSSAFASTEDIFSNAPSSSLTNSPSITISEPSLATPTSTRSQVLPASVVPSNPSPLNYAAWPRKYPDWPPSASLGDRVVLFHGEGTEDVFASSRPKDHRHLRTISAVTNSDGTVVNRPPALHRSLQRSETSAPPPSRPIGLDRRRTLR
jgi:hypothetical protein